MNKIFLLLFIGLGQITYGQINKEKALSEAQEAIKNIMKRTLTILIFLFLLVGNNVFAQSNDIKEAKYSQAINKYNLDKDCGDGGQQEINFCLSIAEKKILNILQVKYDCLIAYCDGQISKYSISAKDSSILTDLKKQKQLLISSQTAWRKLADENASFWEIGGGTITPMYVAQSFIKDIKDRLIWLDDIIEEEGQGNVKEVLKCK